MFRYSNALAAAGFVLALPGAALALDSSALLKRVSDTMGDPRTVRFVAQGTGYTFGQAYVPGGAWPRINVHNLTRTINYEANAMREQITLSRAEPKGGGGYPLAGQQTNDQFVSGNFAWNMAGSNPLPGARWTAERVHALWTSPHGVVKAAIRNSAPLEFVSRGGKEYAQVKFAESGRFSATAYFNDKYQLERVESRYPDAVLGEAVAVTEYSEYQAFGPMQFPGRIDQSVSGHRTLSVIVTEAQANAPADIALPDAIRNFKEVVTTDKVADGVWFVAGGSHNSVAIEMKDHMILVEAPLGDLRSKPVLDAVNKLVPAKPVKVLINSHHHFDHAGGVRTAVAEGVGTVITQAGNKAYFEKNLAVKTTIAPDLLTKSGKKAKVEGVADKRVITDGSRSLEIHRIKDSVHNDTFLMVYLPKEKLLIEADAYTPPAPGGKPAPAPNNANTVNLVQNLERLKLSVDKVLPLHGRVVPGSDMIAASK